MRFCPGCGKELQRRDGEKRAEFLSRSHCNHACSVAARSKRAEDRRRERDLADQAPAHHPGALEFDRAAVLRAAHHAAPQIPVALLDDVVRAVEPLIAANTRHRLLRLVAAKYRATA